MTFLRWIHGYLTRPILPSGANSEIRTIRCRKEDVSIIHATHEVYHITAGNEDGFFRECPKRGNSYDVWDANKIMAYEATAKLLGLSDMVTSTVYATVHMDGNQMLGYYQDKADGICIIGLTHEKRRRILTPEFQRMINCLNVLDVLCHEGDHSPNNYNVVLNEMGRAVGVEAFDNNGRGTFSMRGEVAFPTYKGCSKFLRTDGTINRPYMDAALAQRVKKLNFFRLYSVLRKHLRFMPIYFVWKRARVLRRAIGRTDRRDSGFLLHENEWNEKTVETELSGSYGKTYLVSYIEDCCVPIPELNGE